MNEIGTPRAAGIDPILGDRPTGVQSIRPADPRGPNCVSVLLPGSESGRLSALEIHPGCVENVMRRSCDAGEGQKPNDFN